MRTKITEIVISDKTKEGMPRMTKTGKPYTYVGIKVTDYGAQWLSTNVFTPVNPVLKWKVGDEVDIEVEQNGQYYNFRYLSKQDIRLDEMMGILKDIQDKVTMLCLGESPNQSAVGNSPIRKTSAQTGMDIAPEDIPY